MTDLGIPVSAIKVFGYLEKPVRLSALFRSLRKLTRLFLRSSTSSLDTFRLAAWSLETP